MKHSNPYDQVWVDLTDTLDVPKYVRRLSILIQNSMPGGLPILELEYDFQPTAADEVVTGHRTYNVVPEGLQPFLDTLPPFCTKIVLDLEVGMIPLVTLTHEVSTTLAETLVNSLKGNLHELE